MLYLVVVIVFRTNKVHGEDGTTLRTTVVFVRLVQVDPDNIVGFSRETYSYTW
jgi:hypothetical protein